MGDAMKKLMSASVALAAMIAGPAVAADMPAPVYKAPPMAPLYNWSGFYLGIEGGGAWGQSQFVSADPTANLGLPFQSPFGVSGGLLGGTIGYNWQTRNWVVGAEGDLSWVHQSGNALEVPPWNTTLTDTTTENWLGTGRLRVGVTPTDRWLIYATGGFVVAGVGASVAVPGAGVSSQTQTRGGWTAGGGVEAAINRNWSIKLEYLYVDLQNQNYSFPSFGLATPRTVTLTNDNILRAGINYKFDWGSMVAK